MDIVVTVPKTEYKNNIKERALQDNNAAMYGFRILKRKPKKLGAGDRIYFVRDGMVSYSKEIFEIGLENGMECEVTNREYSGGYCIKFRNERDETHLGIKIKGFQGFRYKWWGGIIK